MGPGPSLADLVWLEVKVREKEIEEAVREKEIMHSSTHEDQENK